jgi:hypothetical protein
MLKRIGISSAALLAMLTCIQPAAVFAEGRDEARYNTRYNNGNTEQRNERNYSDRNEYRGHDERVVRDRDDHDRNDRDRDRNWNQYRDNDDGYRYNSFRR